MKNVFIVFLVLLLVVSSTLCFYFGYLQMQENKLQEEALVEKSSRITELRDEIGEHEDLREELQTNIDTLTAQLAASEETVAELEQRLADFTDNAADSDEYQRALLDEIARLRASAADLRSQLAAAEAERENYRMMVEYSGTQRAELVADLREYAVSPDRPSLERVQEVENPDTGETEEQPVQVPCEVCYYYYDLETGYSVSFRPDEQMYSASVIKAFYVYSMLNAISEFEYTKYNFDDNGNPLFDEEGNPLFEGEHPNLNEKGEFIYKKGEEKYNLNRLWTYNRNTMFKEGSGKIQEMPSGTRMTYRQLVEYALKESDNIAFEQLRKMFGQKEYNAMCAELGIEGYRKEFMSISARDCVKFFAAMYDFMETDDPWGTFLKETLCSTKYWVLLDYVNRPTPVAHKYGWDEGAYHDAGIVYEEHPYIAVVLTDLENGTGYDNEYIRGIFGSMKEIHATLYP